MCNIFRRCMKCCLGRQNNLAQVNPLPVNNVLDDTVNHDLVGQQNYQGMVNPEVPQINEDNIQEENIQEILTEDSSQNNNLNNSEMNNNPLGFDSMNNSEGDEEELEIEDLVIPPNPVNEVQEEVEDNDSPPISFTVTPIE